MLHRKYLLFEIIYFQFEVDCGSSVSMVNINAYNKYLKHLPLVYIKYNLRGATSNMLKGKGEIIVQVELAKENNKLPLIIVQDKIVTPVLGRTLLDKLWPLRSKNMLATEHLGYGITVDILMDSRQQKIDNI